MKHHVGLTIDARLLREIENLRGREKRSTFVEHLLKLGLRAHVNEERKVQVEKDMRISDEKF
jgi:hypothetical protein